MFIQKLGKCIYSERYIYLPCLFDSCLVLLLRLCLCVCSVVSDCFKPVDCSLPGSSVHGIFQASLLEWVAISFSRNLPTQGSNPHFLALTRRFFTHWATLSILFFFKILDIQFTPSAYLLSVCYMLGIVVSAVFSSVAQSCPHLWDTMDCPRQLPCPSPIPGIYSNSCPSSCWCHPIILPSSVPFSSCLQSLPASGSFQMSQFFA